MRIPQPYELKRIRKYTNYTCQKFLTIKMWKVFNIDVKLMVYDSRLTFFQLQKWYRLEDKNHYQTLYFYPHELRALRIILHQYYSEMIAEYIKHSPKYKGLRPLKPDEQ